jgi:hypothetical protein
MGKKDEVPIINEKHWARMEREDMDETSTLHSQSYPETRYSAKLGIWRGLQLWRDAE